MIKNKKNTIFSFVFVCLLLAVSGSIIVQAQENMATIIILPSAGGTITPVPGTYMHAENTQITLEATPDEGFEFLFWIVSGEFTPNQNPIGNPNEVIIDGEPLEIIRFPGIDFLSFTNNPAMITCGFGYTYKYQAVFAPILAGMQAPDSIIFDPFDSFGEWPTSFSEISLVSVSSTIGGATDPNIGRYIFGQNAEPTLTLTATPNEGYEFEYWIVTGDYMPGHGGDSSLDTNVIAVNPLEVTHGMGHSYNYEAVFTLIDMDSGEPQEPDAIHPFGLSSDVLSALIIILVIAVVFALAFGIYMYTKKA